MTEGFSNSVIGGQGTLVRPQIASPNFNIANPAASPTPSWAVLKNGLAYIFGLILTGGTITGPTYVINNTGAYFYSGTPATGNLIESIGVTSATTDPGGLNAVLPGNTRYHNNGAGVFVAQQSTQSYVAYLWQAASALGPYTAMSTFVGFTNQFTASPVLELSANAGSGHIQADDPVAFAGLAGAPAALATPQLYALSSGARALQQQLSSGLAGSLPADQVSATVITKTNPTAPVDITDTFTINANDASIGTTYEIEMPFNGVWEASGALNLRFDLNGSLTNLVPLAAGLATAGHNYGGTWRLYLKVLTTGAGGTCNIWGSGDATDTSVARGGTTSTSLFGINLAHAFNTTVNNTLAIAADFAVSNASQTIVGQGSKFTRSGA